MKDNSELMDNWKELIEVTQRFIKMEPWKQFEDMEIFALKIKGQKEIVYPSIMGFHKLCYGISFYIGNEGFDDFKTAAFENDSERLAHYLIMNSQFMSVYFDDQDNVSYEQMKIYEKMGLKKSEYNHFTIKERNYFPRHPNLKEVKKYIQYINGLISAIDYFFKEDIRIDFKNQYLYYNVENKKHLIKSLNLKPKKFPLVMLGDTEYINSLRDLEKLDEEWEIEMNYTDQGMMCDDDRLANVRMCTIANGTTGTIASCVAMEAEDDEIEVTLYSFLKVVEDNGIPKRLLFGNGRIYSILANTCDILGVELIQSEELAVFDDFIEEYYEYNRNEQVS